MSGSLLAPESVRAPAQPKGRLPFGAGPRLFGWLLVGFLWLIPAFWKRSFLWALLLWDALLLLGWIIDCVRLPRARQIVVERRFALAPSLAATTPVEVALRNQGGIDLHCALVDDAPQQVNPELPRLRMAVAAGREQRQSYAIRPLLRGDLRFGKLYLQYRSALGFCQRWAVADLEQEIRIYPNLERMQQQSVYLTRSRQIELEKRLLRQRGLGREFESLRDYREGDEFRDICWTAAARRGRLVTKQYQMERSQPVWIVLDTGRLLRERVGEFNKLDHAVDAALSLAQLALNSGDRVGLLAYGRRIRTQIGAGRGPAHLRHLLEQLAILQPEAAEADHLRAAATLLALQKRRGLTVWFTDLAETAATPDVIEAASQLLTRQVLLFVVMGQPDLRRAASQRPENLEQMYQGIAAQDLVQRREVLMGRLREQGALTLEAAPHALAPAVLNHYLMVKERSLV